MRSAQAFIRIKERQKEERADLKELQGERTEGQPYDRDRLRELVTKPVAERLADDSHEHDVGRADHADDVRSPGPAQQSLEAEAVADLQRAPEHVEQDIAEHEPETGRGGASSDPIADGGEKVAGGIGKVAEVLANALANIIAPPSPREQAIEKALDRVRNEREAEREPVREEEDRKIRMILHENQRTATDIFESFFNEHAERFRNDEEERRRKRNEQERER